MAYWFGELVEQVCADLLASEDVRDKLALANLPPASTQPITQQIAGPKGNIILLRELHDSLAELTVPIDAINLRRLAVLQKLLPEGKAVTGAEARLRRAERRLGPIDPASRPPLLVWPGSSQSAKARNFLQRWLFASKRAWQAEATAARGALITAQYALETAAKAGDVRLIPELRVIEIERDAMISALREQLARTLAQPVNLMIDNAVTASYEPEFSYSGSAWLVDQPTEEAGVLGAEVNGEAVRTVQNMINSGLTGAVGVAGPRGIGKTTLLTRFARSVSGPWPSPPQGTDEAARLLAPGDDAVQQWGVCVAAPAQYDARDFLLYLFGQLCAAVLGERRIQALEDEMTGSGESAVWPVPPIAAYFAVTALLCGAMVLGLETSRPVGSARSLADLLIAGCCAVVAAMAALAPSRLLETWGQQMAHSGLHRLASASHQSREEANRYAARLVTISRHPRQVRAIIVVVGGIAAGVLSPLVAVGSPPNPGYLAVIVLAAPAAFACVVLRTQAAATFFPVRDRHAAEVFAAEGWYRKVKFQQSYTTGWSGTITLASSALPVQVQAGRSGSKDTTSVSMSVPEIVAAFRAFSEVLSRGFRPDGYSSSIPVVIGIDEVDKIEDPQTAQAFFNQIKGLFGNTPCLFLVAVSDDAMAAYERRGLPLRDAFDSSLSTVVPLSYLSRGEAQRLIGSRLVQVTRPSVDLLYVLSGGLPRELVRLIRHAVDIQRASTHTLPSGGPVNGQPATAGPSWENRSSSGATAGSKSVPVPLGLLAAGLIADQVGAQRRATLIRGRGLDACPARDTLLAWAGDPAADAWAAGRDSADVPGYLDGLFSRGVKLMGACDGTVHNSPSPDARAYPDGCAAEETGAFLFWLATVGQVFGACQSRADFEDAEDQESKRSFERLARARQNFSLGPGYVRAAVTDVRTAWGLSQSP